MRRTLTLSLAALAILSLVGPVTAAPAPGAGKKPKVEVVFCLDTTGSMGGLIEGAKEKIWAICNQIAGGKPTPDLKVGLVAYRDKGDAYITQVFDLTDDLDAIHGHLKTFQAAGGGDTPEHVNQALFDAIHKIAWSTEAKTLRILFLVGDAPPHMDYTDDVKYPETCKKAVARGILINTIQCGSDADCTRVWKDVAARSEGRFAAIPQTGGVVVIETPFDKPLAALNTALTKTVLVWGGQKQQIADRKKNVEALALSPPSAAERVAYQCKNGQCASYCLLDAVKQGKVKLETLKKEELPEVLRKLTLQEQKDYLGTLDKKRTELNKEVLELDRKRADFIVRQHTAEARKGTRSFDAQVLEVLRGQAKKFEIAY